MIVLNVSQCHGGSVSQGKYENSKILEDIGVIGGYDITTEAAITKMMFLFAQNLDNKTLIEFLKISMRGEISRA